MRAAAIVGLGASVSDLKPFQKVPEVEWTIGLPASSADADVILIFGGDGTIHRHLTQLVRLQRPVLVVPCGSGNDFARGLGLRKVQNSLAAWQAFLQLRHARTIDLGTITPRGADTLADARYSGQPTRYFCCAGGCGLDSEAARRANELPAWLRARGGYAVSVLDTIRRFKPVAMKIESPSRHGSRSGFMPMMFSAFANAPFYGGGMRLAPHAVMNDRRLDFCLLHRVNKLRLSYLFPSVYLGRHLNVPEVEYFQGESLRLETEHPLEVYADGEYVCDTPIDVSVVPAALQVVTGSLLVSC
jgi:diacylglycerol kinase (ATP)